jgi:hypothetical protein
MAINRIQFQAGMSMPGFMTDYATEGKCEQVLEATRFGSRVLPKITVQLSIVVL